MYRTGVFSLILALLIGSGGSGGGLATAAPPPGSVAPDLPSLVRATPLIIVGKVLSLQPGRIAGEGEGRLQFNDVRVGVEKRLKGDAPETVVVEQVDMTRRRVLTPEVGPVYKPGERYVLFLSPGEGPRYITLGGQSRYLIDGQTVRAVGVGPVADQVKSADAAKFIEQIQSLAR